MRRSALLLAGIVLLTTTARAADRTWTGAGDGQTWQSAQNWSGGAVPGPADRALIAGASVRLTGPASAQALVLSAGAALDATGFVLTLGTGPSTIAAGTVLTIGGVAAGTSDALVFDGPVAVEGRLDWTGGQVRTDAYYVPPGGKVLTVAPGGTLRWLGAADRTLSAALVNDGTLRWEGGRTLYYQGYSSSSSGLFEIALAADAALQGVGVNSQGPWVWTNTGTVRTTGSATARFERVVLNTVGGTVDVRAGTLDLQASSRHENATVAVAAGATYLLGGATIGNGVWHEIAGTVTGAPTGAFEIDTGGWASGLDAAPAGGVLGIGGTGLQIRHTNVGGRTTGGPPEAAPVNRGLVRFVDAPDNRISGLFRNEGTVRWEAGRVLLPVGGRFESPGVFEIDLAASAEWLGGSAPLTVSGTLRTLGPATATLRSRLDMTGGTADVRAGTLLAALGSRWEDAAAAVALGATLRLGGNRGGEPNVVAGTLTATPAGMLVVGGPPGEVYSVLLGDPARPGVLNVGGTGVQVDNGHLGGGFGVFEPYPAPTNRGLVRFVNSSENRVESLFRNEGLVRWESGQLLMTAAGRFEVASVFEIDLATTAELIGNGALVVSGTLRTLGPATVTLRTGLTVAGGTVDVQAGTLVQDVRSRWEDATVAVALGATLRLAGNRGFEPHVVAGTLAGTPAGAFLVSSSPGGYAVLLGDPDRAGVLTVGGTGVQVDYGYLGGGFGEFDPHPAPRNVGLLRFVGGAQRFIERPFVNDGVVRWEAGQIFQRAYAPVTNRGEWTLAAGAAEWTGLNGATFTNEGTLRAETAARLVMALVNRGGLDVGAGSVAVLSGGAFENAFGGAVWGTGTLDVSGLNPASAVNSGLVVPGAGTTGAGIGVLTWRGPFTMGPQARVLLEVGPGPAADRLDIQGAASLGSQLVVRTVGGYAPAAGDAFDGLTATSRTGTFATVSTVTTGTVVFEADYAQAGRVVLRGVAGTPAPPFVVTPSPLVAGGYRTVALLGDGFAPGLSAALVCVDCADPTSRNGRIRAEVLAVAASRVDVRFDLRDVGAYGDYDLVLSTGTDSTRAPVTVEPYLAVPALVAVGPQGLAVRPAPQTQTVLENLYSVSNAAEPTLFLVEVVPPAGPIRFDALNVRLGPGETAVPRRFFVRAPATPFHAQTLAFGGGINPSDVLFPGQTALPGDPRIPFLSPIDVRFRVVGGLSPAQMAEGIAATSVRVAADFGVTIPADTALARSNRVVADVLYGDGLGQAGLDPSTDDDARLLPALAVSGLLVAGFVAAGYLAQDLFRDLAAAFTPEALAPAPQLPDGGTAGGGAGNSGPAICPARTPDRDKRRRALNNLLDRALAHPNPNTETITRLQEQLDALDQPRGLAGVTCPDEEPVIPQPPRAPVDPNDKLAEDVRGCEIVGTGESARCGRYVIPLASRDSSITYTIAFENLPAATAPAEFVTITDVLDARLDPATFEFMGSTADSLLAVAVVGQTVTFTFTGIDLPPNVTAPEGQGAVTYRVRPRPGLADGTEIRNSAAIVFDFNPPILTPDVVHVVRATANLAVAIDAADFGPVQVPIVYTVRVANPAGADPAQAVALAVPLPLGTTLVDVTTTVGACSGTATLACALGDLAGGAEALVTVRAQPSAVGPAVLTASVASATFDGTWYDNAATRPFGVTANSAGEGGPGALTEVVLARTWPNPFSERATVRLGLPSASSVTVTLVDLLGREVLRAVDGPLEAGWHEVAVEARGLASGVYVAVLRAGDVVRTQRVLVVR